MRHQGDTDGAKTGVEQMIVTLQLKDPVIKYINLRWDLV
jgi:hypothetical protein